VKHTAVGHEAAGKTGEPPESTPPLFSSADLTCLM